MSRIFAPKWAHANILCPWCIANFAWRHTWHAIVTCFDLSLLCPITFEDDFLGFEISKVLSISTWVLHENITKITFRVVLFLYESQQTLYKEAEMAGVLGFGIQPFQLCSSEDNLAIDEGIAALTETQSVKILRDTVTTVAGETDTQDFVQGLPHGDSFNNQ